MNCLYCKNDTEVTNSRTKLRTPTVWRRRRCKTCLAEFSSFEQPIFELCISIKAKDGTLLPFSRDELFLSLYNALKHREDALACATELTSTIIGRVVGKSLLKNGVVDVIDLSKVSYEVLKRFDPLSAGSYKAFYHQNIRNTVS